MRILIADDSAIVRRGMAGLLSAETKWDVCGEAGNGLEALQKARELQPDLVLLDVNLPDINGLEVARRLRLEVPNVKILVISQHDPVQLLPGVIEAGGDGCLDKGRLAADLLGTIEEIHKSRVA
jgi:two-component system, NarL family, nitrate/nitrite response regulator NarL